MNCQSRDQVQCKNHEVFTEDMLRLRTLFRKENKNTVKVAVENFGITKKNIKLIDVL